MAKAGKKPPKQSKQKMLDLDDSHVLLVTAEQLVMLQAIAASESITLIEWFERHSSTPFTEIRLLTADEKPEVRVGSRRRMHADDHADPCTRCGETTYTHDRQFDAVPVICDTCMGLH